MRSQHTRRRSGRRKAVRDHDRELQQHQNDILRTLKLIRSASGNQPSTAEEVSQFEDMYAKQEKLFEKIDAYHAAAGLVTNGQTHHLGKK